MDITDWAAVVFITIVLFATGVLIYNANLESRECQEKGGVIIDRECVKKEAMIQLEKE
mgnify:CR=1 FL=1